MTNTLRHVDEKRAPLSSPAALVSGLILLAFLFGECRSFVLSRSTPDAWPLYVIFAWGAMFSIGLVIWSFRGWFRIHWIGNPTLTVIGGVSGAIITAVTLAIALQLGASQDRVAQSQLSVLCEQLRVMREIERKLALPPDRAAAVPPSELPMSCSAH